MMNIDLPFVRQGDILSPSLFNSYTEDIMRNTGLEEAQAGIKIAGRNINNLRYADDTTLMAEKKVKVKSLSRVRLFVTPWTVAYQVPLSMEFPRDFPGKSTGVICHFLLQGIFPTQGSNPGLRHCRQTLYCLSHQGRSWKKVKRN